MRVLRLSATAAERRTGLSGAQLFALQRLARAPALSLGELAARTLTHPSSVRVVVRRLEARGRVARRHAASDARRLELSVTPAGRALLRRAPASVQDRVVQALHRLRPADRRGLARGPRRLVRELGVEDRAAVAAAATGNVV